MDLPEPQSGDLDRTLAFMADVGYLRLTEVPSIPRLTRSPAVVVYAPLGDTPVAPDVGRRANGELAAYHRDRRATLATE